MATTCSQKWSGIKFQVCLYVLAEAYIKNPGRVTVRGLLYFAKSKYYLAVKEFRADPALNQPISLSLRVWLT
jgi:hypothetical protein